MDPENVSENLENDKIPLRVKKSAISFYENIEKKSSRYLLALIFIYIFATVTYKLWYSEWLNVDQVEQRQLVAELAKPYLPKDRSFRNLTWTYSHKTTDCYLVLEGRFNFTSCAWSCFQARGLATSINSREENDAIWGLKFGRTLKVTGRAWFGLAEINGEWTNVDGTKVNYTNWEKDEPNNSNGLKFCAQFHPITSKWYSTECDRQMPFCLCKDYGVACHP